jgi:hypothetical protein
MKASAPDQRRNFPDWHEVGILENRRATAARRAANQLPGPADYRYSAHVVP